MKVVTIAEMKTARRQLEKDILFLISKFEKEYGLSVYSVDTDSSQNIKGERETYDVNVRIEL